MLEPNYFLVDFIYFLVALLTNLLMFGVGICRIRNWEKAQEYIGFIILLFGFPAGYVLIINILAGRYWWTIVIPMIFIAFIIFDFLLDYVELIDYDFRENKKIQVPFLITYYVAFFTMLPYVFFTINSIYSFMLIWLYIAQLLLSGVKTTKEEIIEVSEDFNY